MNDVVERARLLARRIVADFRPNGWPAKEDEIARLIIRTFGDDAALADASPDIGKEGIWNDVR